MSRMFKQLLSLTLAIMFLVCLMPVSASAAEVTTILSDGTFDAGWTQKDFNTSNWGGTVPVSTFTEGGKFTVIFTGENVWNVHLCLNAPWTQITHEADTFTSLGDGSYMVTFSYEECVNAYGDLSGVGSVSLVINSEAGATGVSFTYNPAEGTGDAGSSDPTDPTDATDATGETAPEVEDASSGTTVFSGSQTVNENWTVGVDILTAIAGGSFDSSVLAEGGYFTVNYTGTSGQVYFATQDNVNWGWYSVNTPSSTVASGDGYVSTFTYADIVAAYGGAADLSDLGKLVVGTTEPGAPVTITRVAWHEPAASDEEDPTDAPEASEPTGSSKELLKAPVTVGEGWQMGCRVDTTNWGGSFYAGQISKEDSFTVKLTGENLFSVHLVLQGTDGSWNQRDLEVSGMSVDADGNYVATFNCADYGMEKFSGIGAIYVYVNTDVGGSATVNSFTYNTDSPSDGSNPSTGDTFTFWLIPVMLVSAAALVAVIGKRKQFMA